MVFGYAGGLYWYKGVDYLCEAMKRMPDDRSIIVGGKDSEDIERLVKEYGDCGNIEFFGHVRNDVVEGILGGADVLVLPQSYVRDIGQACGSSPMKLFEYARMCRPILASDIPAVREIITDGENGVLFRADDVDDLVEKMGVMKGAGDFSDMVGRAYKMAVDNTWDSRALRVVNFMEDVLRFRG